MAIGNWLKRDLNDWVTTKEKSLFFSILAYKSCFLLTKWQMIRNYSGWYHIVVYTAASDFLNYLMCNCLTLKFYQTHTPTGFFYLFLFTQIPWFPCLDTDNVGQNNTIPHGLVERKNIFIMPWTGLGGFLF